MRTLALRHTLQIADPDPFGDVTLAPSGMTGRSEAVLARDMAAALLDAPQGTDTQALRPVRLVFPQTPLTVRMAALAAMMRR
jgi:hypothetical protein